MARPSPGTKLTRDSTTAVGSSPGAEKQVGVMRETRVSEARKSSSQDRRQGPTQRPKAPPDLSVSRGGHWSFLRRAWEVYVFSTPLCAHEPVTGILRDHRFPHFRESDTSLGSGVPDLGFKSESTT